MQGFPLGGLDDLKRYYSSVNHTLPELKRDKLTFWMSETDSQKKPMAKRTIPAISLLVPKEGFAPPRERSDTAGELSMTVGSASTSQRRFTLNVLRVNVQTTQTQRI